MGKTCQTLSGHTDHVTSLAFAPDAGELVSGGCDGRVVVWDLTAPVAKQLHRIQSAHTGPIHAVAMSPDGTAFVTGAADKTVHVWSTTPPAKGGGIRGARPAEKTSTTDQTRGEHVEPEVTLKLQGHLSDVTCCAFGRTAASLATGSLDHPDAVEPVGGDARGHPRRTRAPVCDVSYSRDGRFLVSASRDHHVRLWHPRSGETVLTLRQSAGALTARLSPDASRLLVGADDASVSVWGWIGREGSASMGQNPQRPRLFARGHALRDDDAETRRRRPRVAHRSIGRVRSVEAHGVVGWAKGGPKPAAFDGQGTRARQLRAAFFAPSEDDAPNSSTAGSSADGSPGGSSSAARRDRERARREKMAARLPVLTGGDDGYLRKISTIRGETGKVTMTFKGHAKAIRAVAASPDMSTAVSASDDGTLMLWDTQTGLDSGVLAGHEGPASQLHRPTAVACSRGGKIARCGFGIPPKPAAARNWTSCARTPGVSPPSRPRGETSTRQPPRIEPVSSGTSPPVANAPCFEDTSEGSPTSRSLGTTPRRSRSPRPWTTPRARGTRGILGEGRFARFACRIRRRIARRVPGRARGGRCARATVCTSSTLGRGGRWRTFRDSPR